MMNIFMQFKQALIMALLVSVFILPVMPLSISFAQAEDSVKKAVDTPAPENNEENNAESNAEKKSKKSKPSAKTGGVKELSGISIIGNKEAPKSLYIVPWKNSEVGVRSSLTSGLLDDSMRPIDKEVFERELDFYELSHSK